MSYTFTTEVDRPYTIEYPHVYIDTKKFFTIQKIDTYCLDGYWVDIGRRIRKDDLGSCFLVALSTEEDVIRTEVYSLDVDDGPFIGTCLLLGEHI